MKIAQFFDKGCIRLGIIDADSIIPLDFQGEMIDFIKKGSDCKPSGKAITLDRIKIAPPVSNPSKIMAIGLNYMDHIRESKGEVPESPLIFAKFPSSLIGHNDWITWDENLTKKVDFEAELAVIIGKAIHNCPKNEVMKTIFGYTCANDVSARDLQFASFRDPPIYMKEGDEVVVEIEKVGRLVNICRTV